MKKSLLLTVLAVLFWSESMGQSYNPPQDCYYSSYYSGIYAMGLYFQPMVFKDVNGVDISSQIGKNNYVDDQVTYANYVQNFEIKILHQWYTGNTVLYDKTHYNTSLVYQPLEPLNFNYMGVTFRNIFDISCAYDTLYVTYNSSAYKSQEVKCVLVSKIETNQGLAYYYKPLSDFILTSKNVTGIQDLASQNMKLWAQDGCVKMDLGSNEGAVEKIELYDLQGNLIIEKNDGLQSLESFTVQGGLYLAKVTLSNQTIIQDKVLVP